MPTVPGAEDVLLPEEHLGVFMRVGLVVAGEVKVDVRRLLAVEAEEGLERDVVPVHQHRRAALGAVFRRQVEAAAHLAVGEEFRMAAFRAAVVRRQRLTSDTPQSVAMTDEPTDPREPTR